MIRAIEHMAIAAKDTAALARWYRDTLGFRVVVEGGQGTWFIGPPEGEALIEIIRATEAPHAERARNDPGFSLLAFAVTDFDAVCDSLAAKGVTFTGGMASGGGTGPATTPAEPRLAFFPDPEGNVLQIVWRPKPLGS